MMKPDEIFLTRDQTRAADQFAIEQLGIPGVVLMENAGRGCTEILLRQLASEPHPRTPPGILICCGPGNNGGDGLVIARHLQIAGVQSQILLMGESQAYSGDALVNLRILRKLGQSFIVWKGEESLQTLAGILRNWTRRDWIVDALLGTGFQGELREPYAAVVQVINQCKGRRLAVDIPTGLCCDTGQPSTNCFQADLTATLIAQKTGFRNPAAQMFLGQVDVVSIGVPVERIVAGH